MMLATKQTHDQDSREVNLSWYPRLVLTTVS